MSLLLLTRSPDTSALPAVHDGAVELRVRLRLEAGGGRRQHVRSVGDMRVSLTFRASGSSVAAEVGAAWSNVSLEVGDDPQTSSLSALGAAQVGVVLAEKLDGSVQPNEITNIQHQGAAKLKIKNSFTADGRPLPVLDLPPQAQSGKTQMSFGLALASATAQSTLGQAPVTMLFGWQAGGETAPGGQVITHPKELAVAFVTRPNRNTIVAVPHVADWDAVALANQTLEEGDPEFFNPSAVIGGGVGVAGNSWK